MSKQIILPGSSLDGIIITDLNDYPKSLAERHEILPNLWLGEHPNVLPDEIKYVISCNGAMYPKGHKQHIISTYFEDGAIVPPEPYLTGLAETVLRCWKDGPTLVHCAAGMNRSALVMGLALIRNGMTAKNAINLMRTMRSKGVLHNRTFEQWLLSK